MFADDIVIFKKSSYSAALFGELEDSFWEAKNGS